MAGDSVEIRIIAHDGTSQVFRAIQQNADRLGRDLTDAGKDGDRAFDQIEKGAKDADRALEQAQRSARSFGDGMQGAARTIDDFGEGLIVLGAGLTYAGNKAMEQERQIISLRRAFGDTAEEMLSLAQELDDITIFSDEDIRAGERFFATLQNNYGFTMAEIREVAQITADLASASGVTYEDASNRVTAALRGEAEAAEYLGLTMNQQSIDRENLTLSMSNEEAAHFRLNALREQSAVYQGTANDLAQSSIGTYAELTDTVNDFAGAIGSAIGPIGSITTGIGTMAIGLSGTVGVFGKVTSALRNSQIAMSAASLAMNPMVLGLGALTVAGVAWYQTLDEGESVLDRFEAGMDALFLENEGQNFFENLADGIKTFAVGADEASLKVKKVEESLKSLQEAAVANNSSELAVAESTMRSVDAVNDRFLAGEQLINGLNLEETAQRASAESGRDYQEVLKEVTEEYETSQNEITAYLEAQQSIGQAFLDGKHDTEALQSELTLLHNLYMEGVLTHDNYKSSLVGLADNLDDYLLVTEETTAAQGKQISSLNILSTALEERNRFLEEYARVQDEAAEADRRREEHDKAYAENQQRRFDEERQRREQRRAEEEADRAERERAAAEHAEREASHDQQYADQQQQRYDEERARREQRRNEERADREARERAAADAAQREAEHEEAAAAAQQQRFDEERAQREQRRADEQADHEARVQRARDFISTMREVSGFDSPLATLDMTSLSTDAMAFARYVGVGNDALSNTFRIVVSNTNAMGQTVQATADWIDELAYAEDGWTKVNQLQADGFINEQQMNAVFTARTSILEDNAHVQNDILTMQALQAPLMADLVSQQADYIHQLSNQSAEQQLVALGWMDSASAAQAYTIVTQAAAVATGDLGATGRAAFEDMVQGAIAANPVLETMLTDIGLIARDHEGNLTFNYDGMEQANSEIKMLTESILLLVDVLDDGKINGSVNVDTLEAQQRVQDLADDLGLLDGETASVTVEGDGSPAQNVMASVADQLRGLDGQTATTYQEGVPDGALGAISSVAQDLAGLDGDSATVTINAIDNAGGVLGSVAAQLWALDGQSATVTTNYVTAYSTVGSPAGPRAFADGGTVWGDDAPRSPWGVIPRAANGRTVLVGEVGPELVTLPHGAQVTPHVASLSRTEPGGISISIPIYGNVYGIDDLTEQVTRQLAPEIRAVAEDIRASQMRVN